MKIALAQINPTIGDFDGNTKKILDFAVRAQEKSADLVVFPELSLPGYPPKDLLLRQDFIEAQVSALDKIAKQIKLPTIIGAALTDEGKLLFNTAVFCHEGRWQIAAKKILLPNYNIFDEKRYFKPNKNKQCSLFTLGAHKILISICEDAWGQTSPSPGVWHDIDPIGNALAHGDAQLIINISASPYSVMKPSLRQSVFVNLARKFKKPVLVACQVGGNDQLLFDGQSLIIDEKARVLSRGKLCEEDLLIYDHDRPNINEVKTLQELDRRREIIEVLSMGLKDYVNKCAMPGVIIGVSGGIDSAVCLALAHKALGKERVKAVYLPSQFSSDQSHNDAQKLCANLNLKLEIIPIEASVSVLRTLLKPYSLTASPGQADLMDQNLQARVRGLMIMALSNISSFLMIATSNKSELAVGYSTAYGDMCGALSLIGDLYKTQVYEIARAFNQPGEIIPTSTIERAPTAELKPGQLDCDLLPEYKILDQILFNFIDLEMKSADISAKTKIDRALIDSVIKMVSLSEYKRRQAPFPLMVSDKVFGDARRLPIAKFHQR